jgi:8-oxo-dGTP pyrophosphatase MutT (NUDIX family)
MTENESFVVLLADRLTGRRRVEPDRNGFLRAGVLVPLIVHQSGQELLFTKRTDHVETHKGQISFPGGVVDETDADIVETAQREMEEELGVPRTAVQTVGLLDDLPTPTGFIITPVVGVFRSSPPMSPNQHEVAEVFTVPLQFFADVSHAKVEHHILEGVEYETWRYNHRGRIIWGATAHIIQSLLRRLGHI